ncbi:MAG: BON domain-containing protein [Rhodospirillaceae bacterium]|jgi:osmotically-inducible protein OsmY|nr:BON domain-containing protein [Rhodospirillaceae bacterium]MBT3886435.1 BON domain-containing protein [Rhodospirillaceae bacterium]MBT4118259.1 BON domain-containing protein [Rhodospirillaceae bacterium]MBT4673102.1 BON domain-containing protein [Rhodospirillaceae bacterium]MBT4721296.1 BON domain-containing protein [Rhodospirillaceae bacterium]
MTNAPKRHHRLPRFAILLLLLLPLTGCAAAVGAGAGVGVAAVSERGIKTRAIDLKIEAFILKEFLVTEIKSLAIIDVEVYEGRVLLTGTTTDTKLADQAVALAWKASGVTEVINEVQLNKAGTAANYVKDTWITTQLTTKLTLDGDVLSINYSIETVNGVVYLIGIAQDKQEIDRVIAHAGNIEFVRRVVNHTRIKKPPLT